MVKRRDLIPWGLPARAAGRWRGAGQNEQHLDSQNGRAPRAQVSEIGGAGEGNRTLVISLEGCCSTIELHPRLRLLRDLLISQFRSVVSSQRLGRNATSDIFQMPKPCACRGRRNTTPVPTA